MFIRSAGAAVVFAVAMLAGQANAQSPIMSVNHIVTNNLPHYECMRRASYTLRLAIRPIRYDVGGRVGQDARRPLHGDDLLPDDARRRHDCGSGGQRQHHQQWWMA